MPLRLGPASQPPCLRVLAWNSGLRWGGHPSGAPVRRGGDAGSTRPRQGGPVPEGASPLGLFPQTLQRPRLPLVFSERWQGWGELTCLGRRAGVCLPRSQRREEGGDGKGQRVCGAVLVQPRPWRGPRGMGKFGQDFPGWTPQQSPRGGNSPGFTGQPGAVAGGRGRGRKGRACRSIKLKISSIRRWSPRKAASPLKALAVTRRQAFRGTGLVESLSPNMSSAG